MSYKEDVKQLLPGLSKKILLWSAVQKGNIGTQYSVDSIKRTVHLASHGLFFPKIR